MSRILLTVQELSCGYPGRILVNGLSFTLEPGAALAIIGPNGAGKTTLLKTLAGLLPLQSGHVLLEGRAVLELHPTDRAREVALLCQDDRVDESLTVRELVELGRIPYLGLWGRLGAADRAAVEAALQACQLTELAGQRLDRISGGERQRARIALAVAQQTPLLLLDEPANHLDLRRRCEFYELMRELRRQRELSVIMVLHDLAEAYREAETVLVLAGGHAQTIAATDPERAAKLARAFEVAEDRIPPAGY